MGRGGWSGWLAAVMALAGLPVVAGTVWLTSPSEPPDPAAELSRELAADGEPADVIGCVLRLAAHDLRTGPLDGERQRELVDGCEQARRSLAATVHEDEDAAESAQPDDRPDTLGDDPRLDRLWEACDEGSGVACDRLFELAPPGTGYESFGLTCGDRAEILDCADLDHPLG